MSLRGPNLSGRAIPQEPNIFLTRIAVLPVKGGRAKGLGKIRGDEDSSAGTSAGHPCERREWDGDSPEGREWKTHANDQNGEAGGTELQSVNEEYRPLADLRS